MMIVHMHTEFSLKPPAPCQTRSRVGRCSATLANRCAPSSHRFLPGNRRNPPWYPHHMLCVRGLAFFARGAPPRVSLVVSPRAHIPTNNTFLHLHVHTRRYGSQMSATPAVMAVPKPLVSFTPSGAGPVPNNMRQVCRSVANKLANGTRHLDCSSIFLSSYHLSSLPPHHLCISFHPITLSPHHPITLPPFQLVALTSCHLR